MAAETKLGVLFVASRCATTRSVHRAYRGLIRDATKAGYAYVVMDGTLIPIDRVAADRPFYSGKHADTA